MSLCHRGNRHPGSLLFGLLTVLLVANVALAGPTATIRGRVTYPTGVVISGVRVEATNIETNVTFSGETNAVGLYAIPYLPPGTYRVILRKFALRTIVFPGVELQVQDDIALNFSMELGSAVKMLDAGTPRIQADAQRGGNFSSREVQELPLLAMNPISLARTLPGAVSPALTNIGILDWEAIEFSVNGARVRGNNHLLDSTENNDIAFTGVAQPFKIADAVEEVSVQTDTFGVEFGRATGAVIDVVTKSGTNRFQGTTLWRYQSQRFNSVSNVEKQTSQSHSSDNVYAFTLGGPIRRDKTFLFTGYQQDNHRSSQNFPLTVPTAEAVATLRSLFPSNPRLDLYMGFLGSLRGTTASPIPVVLGADPITGIDRGSVEFASAPLTLPQSNGGPQWLVRLDHNLSESHQLAFRYINDSDTNSPVQVYFPGFVLDQGAQNQNLLLTDLYSFSPNWTNEFRFSYGRQETDFRRLSPQSVPEAQTQPRINIANDTFSAPGVASNLLQDRRVTNLLFQETQTRQSGRHTFRYGVEILKQLAIQRPGARFTGELVYNGASDQGYDAFANFLDDYSGPRGRALKDFGAAVFHPDQLHQTYFFEDRWLPAPSLSLTTGIRYENFGQPANALQYPAFAGFNPDDFLKPNRVNTDNNNFGPAFGLAWSPSFRSGWLSKVFGENETVLRGGYQISYDAFFTQMIALQMASSSPNGISRTTAAILTGRGNAEWSKALPVDPLAPSVSDSQQGVLDKNLRSPYTERWSFGFQRELFSKFLLDGSYVGSESHKLMTWENLNPLDPLENVRPHPDFGVRQIRASHGNSSYHAMQWRVDRRFADGIRVTASYTWSRSLDSTSEGSALVNNQNAGGNLPSRPAWQGGLKLDHGPSDHDRTHRLTFLYLWNIRGPERGVLKEVFGGWSLTGITTFQSGAPFSVQNGGTPRGGGGGNDRPDIGNPAAPVNSRAILDPTCTTGYLNPDTNVCVTPKDVHWIQGSGPPNASTVGRNTLRAGGINNFDLCLSKSFRIGEQRRLEFRWEAFNALNHPQFTQIPEKIVLGGTPSRFLNRDFTDSGIRSMWLQVKLVF